MRQRIKRNLVARFFRCVFVMALGLWLVACGGVTAQKSGQAGAPSAPAPQPSTPLTAAAAIADVRELASLLEATHPDPYVRGGGRVAFQRRVHEILQAIPAKGLTVRQLQRLVRPLLAAIGDGHTVIDTVWETQTSRATPLELEVVEERLYVSGVYRETDRPALGGRITAVEGIPWPALVERMGRFQGFDNAYTNLTHLADALLDVQSLEDLLERDSPLASVRLEVERPDQTRLALEVPVLESLPEAALRPASHIALPETNAAGIGWGFLADDKSVAVLSIDSMMAYREAFEIWRALGYTGMDWLLPRIARQATGANQPLGASYDEQLAAVPSATETFRDLFRALNEAHTRTLLVDLRRNGGGNSFLATILAYFLYPLDRLLAQDSGYQIPRYSALYLANRDAGALEEHRKTHGALLKAGDLDFYEEEQWRERQAHGLSAVARQRAIDELSSWAAKAPTFDAWYRKGDGNAVWSGKVIVLGSARTYSAGFDALAMLVQSGATYVGVPSAQAGNCFIDALPFTLSRSGLRGSISFKWSVLFPDDPLKGTLLRPDVELTYATLAAMGFDPHASVRLALEKAR